MSENNDWRNLKTGNIYMFICFAIDCTNERDGTEVVIYREKYKKGEVFIREFKEFAEKFEPMDKRFFALRDKILAG